MNVSLYWLLCDPTLLLRVPCSLRTLCHVKSIRYHHHHHHQSPKARAGFSLVLLQPDRTVNRAVTTHRHGHRSKNLHSLVVGSERRMCTIKCVWDFLWTSIVTWPYHTLLRIYYSFCSNFFIAYPYSGQKFRGVLYGVDSWCLVFREKKAYNNQ